MEWTFTFHSQVRFFADDPVTSHQVAQSPLTTTIEHEIKIHNKDDRFFLLRGIVHVDQSVNQGCY